MNKKNKNKKTQTASLIEKDKPAQENISGNINSTELQRKLTTLTDNNRILKRKIFDLYTIFEINRNFNTVLDYQLLLDTFIFTSLAQVSASKAAIYLEKNLNEKIYYLTKYRGSGIFPDYSLTFNHGSEMLKYITRLNRPARIEDILEDLAIDKEKEILQNFNPGVLIPLVHQTNLIGIFVISDKMSERPFVDDDIEFLSILGNQISVAIENTRLYEAEKKATKLLRTTQEQLVQSERLAALGEMSAKVAHEINNPLGIIKNYLLLADKAVGDNKEAIEYTGIVSDEIDRIAQIVRELLDFHRPKGFDIKKIDVAKVVSDVLHLAQRQFEISNIILTKRFDPKCPKVNASPENLKQVFLNLIINAIDVMEKGGKFEVSVLSKKTEVYITFSDTGPGIPAEQIPRIFDPFFTTKSPSKGNGLGLSVCYGIIKKHQGSINFKNLKTGGCFEIRLPAVISENKK